MPIVPGLGFAGLGQTTRAAQLVYQRAMRMNGGRSTGSTRRRSRTRKRSRVKASSAGSKRRKRSARKPARLVRGSAAAKRYMAKIRKMRRR